MLLNSQNSKSIVIIIFELISNVIGEVLEIVIQFYGKCSSLMEGCHKIELLFIKLRNEPSMLMKIL